MIDSFEYLIDKRGVHVVYTGPLEKLMMNPAAVPYICAIKENGKIVGYIDSRPAGVPLIIRQVPAT